MLWFMKVTYKLRLWLLRMPKFCSSSFPRQMVLLQQTAHPDTQRILRCSLPPDADIEINGEYITEQWELVLAGRARNNEELPLAATISPPILPISLLMSCLRIRLPPAKKAWKSFTSILQTRLHKLHKSKTIKKPRNNNRLQTAASKTTRPSLFSGQRLQFKSKKRRRALPFGYQRYYVSRNKAAAPVYVDKLFKDAPVSEVVGYIQKQPLEKNNGKKLIDEGAAEAGTSNEGEKHGAEKSVGLALPMLYGIDAKAEEFIASFRAEMERQEIIALNL
ncbi:hypothetical protein V6N13_100176 [Hibiscus sabdariffa]